MKEAVYSQYKNLKQDREVERVRKKVVKRLDKENEYMFNEIVDSLDL